MIKKRSFNPDVIPKAITHKYVARFQRYLIEEGVLVWSNGGQQLMFTRDYIFKHPSIAASIAAGKPESGYDGWKAPDYP